MSRETEVAREIQLSFAKSLIDIYEQYKAKNAENIKKYPLVKELFEVIEDDLLIDDARQLVKEVENGTNNFD